MLGASNPETVRLLEAVNDEGPVYEPVGFLDNDRDLWGKSFWGHPVLGGSELVADPAYRGCVVVNAITRDTTTRKQTTDELLSHGAELANLIHPSVDLRHVRLGRGNIIQEGVILQPGVEIGDNCAINGGAIVPHECCLADHIHLAPGAGLAGLVTLEEGVMCGVGSVVLPRLTVGAWSIVGAGAVVTKDVPPGSVAAGNPARFTPRSDP